jgi:C4-type Zn-finger protein
MVYHWLVDCEYFMTKPIESEDRQYIACIKCGEMNDLTGFIERIGHLQGMVTKSFNCSKCGEFNNYSKSVNDKNPILKAILGNFKLKRGNK